MNNAMQINVYLGLDISKDKIDGALLINGKYKHKVFTNQVNGFERLVTWLQQNEVDVTKLHVCCEATNVYYLAVAKFLYQHKIIISVINPAIIKHYAQYKLKRIKTDKQDAKLIAQFCRSENPEHWQPANEDKIKLKSMCRRADQLNQLLTMEKNRSYVSDESSQESVQRAIAFLEIELTECRKQIQNVINNNVELKHKQIILKSIVGIGETTSQVLLSVLVDIDKFPTACHLISWLGLSPVIKQSGKYKGMAKISKMGDKMIRKALYTPARVACTRSKLWRSWFEKHVQTKPPKKVYVMMMVKLVKYAYYCIKTDTLFNAEFHTRAA